MVHGLKLIRIEEGFRGLYRGFLAYGVYVDSGDQTLALSLLQIRLLDNALDCITEL